MLTKFYLASLNKPGEPVYLLKNLQEAQDIHLADYIILGEENRKWLNCGGFYPSQIIKELSVPEIIAYRLQGILSAEDIQ